MGKVVDSAEGLAIYINWDNQEEKKQKLNKIEPFLVESGLTTNFSIVETACGVILTLLCKGDVAKFSSISHEALTNAIGSVNIFKMASKKTHYKQGVFLQEVPWGLPLEELKAALNQQGMGSARVERKKQYVRVEVTEPEHYEVLLRNGLQFFNVARFPAIPDRGVRTSLNWHDRRSTLKNDSTFVLQCYRCQGWWHTAGNCRYKVRCVRCGGHHSVEACLQPRSEPICCHCSGPHTASNKFCPVRLSLVNAFPVSLTLTSDSETAYNPYQHVL